MTRKGKIARLPRQIRDELNHRLDEGEQSARLAIWLNSLEEVRAVLEMDFGSRPITEQNLSDWKQGGYVDWQQLQESREWVRIVTDEADQVAEDSGLMPLSDRISSMAALALGKVIRSLGTSAESDSAKREDLMRVLKELARLRRDDLEAARSHAWFEMVQSKRTRRARHSAAA
jgi:hypothetical protein